MNRTEAIEFLNSIKDKYIHGGDDFYDYQRRTAIDYAVAVLECREIDRKKLIELLSAVSCNGNGESLGSCPDRKNGLCREFERMSYCTIQNLANHLIANGVTVTDNNVGGKWIPVTERLPLEEWEYFTAENDWDVYPCLAVVKTNRGGRYVTKMFYTGENFVDDEYVRYTAQVTHWMPLPEPPKGE